MKIFPVLLSAAFFSVTVTVSAQAPPKLPVPVTETEVREDSIKMRSNELERIKRDSTKPLPDLSDREKEIRFARVKDDFEKIQKLQDNIVKAYTTEKIINYKKINRSAAEMNESAKRLSQNLFGSNENEAKPDESKKEDYESKSVRDLIIELDNVIGKFVGSSIFNNDKSVGSDESAKAQTQLEKIIFLSDRLERTAGQTK